MRPRARRAVAVGIGLVLLGAFVYARPSLQREMQRRTIRDYVRRIVETRSIPSESFEVTGAKPERLDYLIVGVDGGDTVVVSSEGLRSLREGRGLKASIYEETLGFCLVATETTLYQDLFVYYHPTHLPDGLGACARARYVDVVSFSGTRHQLYDLETLSHVAAWEGAPPPVPIWMR